MSQNRKMLKLLSFAQVIAAVAAVVMAVGAANGGPVEGLVGQVPALAACGLFALCGLLSFSSALYGIRGANRPSSLGAHRILSALGLIAGGATIIIAGTPAIVLPTIVIIASGAAVYLDIQVVKETDR